MSNEQRLKELGIELPETPSPLGAYVPCVRTGNLVFVSGMLPFRNGKLIRLGKVGAEVTPDDAASDAEQSAINALAVVRKLLGSLDKITACVKINGYIASAADFIGQPKVMNGASDLVAKVFGEKGMHARAAVGVLVLPMNSPVEIDFIFEVRADRNQRGDNP